MNLSIFPSAIKYHHHISFPFKIGMYLLFRLFILILYFAPTFQILNKSTGSAHNIMCFVIIKRMGHVTVRVKPWVEFYFTLTLNRMLLLRYWVLCDQLSTETTNFSHECFPIHGILKSYDRRMDRFRLNNFKQFLAQGKVMRGALERKSLCIEKKTWLDK